MKRNTILLLSLLCSILLSAQTYVWKDGKIEWSANTCDIRFEKIPAENFHSLTSVVEMNNYLYNMFGQDKSFRNRLSCGYQGYNTDIERNVKNSGLADWAIYTLDADNGDLSAANAKDPWNYFAKIVYNASAIIDGIVLHCDTTNSAFAYCLGEALFLRAFALSEMVKLWGDVPLKWKLYNGSMMPAQAKQDRNMAYEAIRADFKRAATLLPWAGQIPQYNRSGADYREPTMPNSSQDTYMEHPESFCNYTGAPNKAAALALLARTDLNYAGYAMKPNNLGTPADGFCIQLNLLDENKRRALYQEALDACAQIIQQEGDWKLLDHFEDVFKNICADVTDYTKSEVIWEIPFADGVRGQVLQYNCPKMSNALEGLKNNQSGSSNSALVAVPTLFFDFEADDQRRDVTIAPYNWYYDDGSTYTSLQDKMAIAFPEVDSENKEKFLYQHMQPVNIWYFAKYRVEWMSRMRTGNDDGVNYPIIRYADVLLMFCEAAIGGITGDAPQNSTGIVPQAMFDKIRSRAGLASKQLTMKNLMDERKFEFAGEALRKYDLIRWGELRNAMVYARGCLDDLDAHRGVYSNTSDTIYFRFRYVGSELSYNASIKGYVIDDITFTRPAHFDSQNGWVKKNVFGRDETERYLNKESYILYPYDHPEYLDNHQLWPIFNVNINSSKGLLWNDYNY